MDRTETISLLQHDLKLMTDSIDNLTKQASLEMKSATIALRIQSESQLASLRASRAVIIQTLQKFGILDENQPLEITYSNDPNALQSLQKKYDYLNNPPIATDKEVFEAVKDLPDAEEILKGIARTEEAKMIKYGEVLNENDEYDVLANPPRLLTNGQDFETVHHTTKPDPIVLPKAGTDMTKGGGKTAPKSSKK